MRPNTIVAMGLLVVVFGLTLSACGFGRKAEIYIVSQQTELLQIDGFSQMPIGDAGAPRGYYFDTGANPTTNVLFVDGSGCTSPSAFVPAYLRGLQGAARVFVLEKPGVQKGDKGFSCSDEFYAHDNFETRLAQNNALLDWMIKQKTPAQKTVIIGVSEGGPIAAALTHRRDADLDAVLIIGAGGWPQRQSLETLAARGAPFDVAALDAKIAVDPNSQERIYGHSVAYWASYLDVALADDLRETRTPVLVVMGSDDQSEPIESLEFLEAQALPNVKTLVINDADHVLMAGGQDFKPKVLTAFSDWVGLAE